MKPENKLPVLDLISAEMKTVVNTLQPDLPSWPATGTIAEQRQYYTLERRFWNAGAPEMATRAYMVPILLIVELSAPIMGADKGFIPQAVFP